MSRSNCLAFALRRWRYRLGYWLEVRKSKWGQFPHFGVMLEQKNGDLVRREYKPVEPRRRLLPPLFFKGKTVTTRYTKRSECLNCEADMKECEECKKVD